MQHLVQARVGHQLIDEEVEVRCFVVATERNNIAVFGHGVGEEREKRE